MIIICVRNTSRSKIRVKRKCFIDTMLIVFRGKDEDEDGPKCWTHFGTNKKLLVFSISNC